MRRSTMIRVGVFTTVYCFEGSFRVLSSFGHVFRDAQFLKKDIDRRRRKLPLAGTRCDMPL